MAEVRRVVTFECARLDYVFVHCHEIWRCTEVENWFIKCLFYLYSCKVRQIRPCLHINLEKYQCSVLTGMAPDPRREAEWISLIYPSLGPRLNSTCSKLRRSSLSPGTSSHSDHGNSRLKFYSKCTATGSRHHGHVDMICHECSHVHCRGNAEYVVYYTYFTSEQILLFGFSVSESSVIDNDSDSQWQISPKVTIT